MSPRSGAMIVGSTKGGTSMSTIAPTQPMAMPVDPVNPGWVPSPLYRMTVEKYEAMVTSGAFTKRDRFHLINGYLVEKMTQNPPHTSRAMPCGRAGSSAAGRMVRATRQTHPASRRGQRARARRASCAGTMRDYADAIPGRVMSPWSSRSPIRASAKTARWPRSMGGRHPGLLDRQPGRPPGRGLHRSGPRRLRHAHRLPAGPVGTGRDRRPGDRPDRGRRHPPLIRRPRSGQSVGRTARSGTAGTA